MTALSLCSGYGGLDLAVEQVLGTPVTWHAENDPAASAVLAARWLGVPNLGDLTAVDWSALAPVDVLCAGFPCQDLSYAGRGGGIVEGNRSGLWHAIARAIGVLRPRVVVLENVAGIVTRRPGLDVVLADLARLGFDAEWCCLRASDVGAPHGRNRWFCLAWLAHANGTQWGRPPRHAVTAISAGTAGLRSAQSRGRSSDAASDAERGELQRRGVGRVLAGPAEPGAGEGLQRQRDRHPADDGGADAADTDSRTPCQERDSDPPQPVTDHERRWVDPRGRVLDWGAYGPAVARWERLTRPAPAPTQVGTRGKRQLSPRFVEWMMGLPDGWVTCVPASRNDQLRVLGNGVVPQQATAALELLLNRAGVERAA